MVVFGREVMTVRESFLSLVVSMEAVLLAKMACAELLRTLSVHLCFTLTYYIRFRPASLESAVFCSSLARFD